MALKSNIIGRSEGESGFEVLVTDDMIGREALKSVPLSRCVEVATEAFLEIEVVSEEVFCGIARALAVREYLTEMGQDPDAPTLGG